MRNPVVIVGIGEMAGVFARGFLCCGYPVYPITRKMEMATEARHIPEPALVLLAVGENDLDQTLAQIPDAWRNRLALLQNELLPQAWQAYNLKDPTVISVWLGNRRATSLARPVRSSPGSAFTNNLGTGLEASHCS